MFCSRKLVLLVAAATSLVNATPTLDSESHAAAVAACNLVRENPDLSPAFPGTVQYDNDVSHWSNASSLPSMCSVKPSGPQDIQRLFEIIKKTRTPWAVKGKGHCNNNNMSSTNGLQIAMSEFRQIEVSADKKSVRIGTGLDWRQVYTALERHGLIVAGGRTPNVGVAGLLLSSGYSWITNEVGFGIDNILSADIVLPDGTFTTVSETQDPDLFFALQGGTNNFGIVTSFTIRAFPVGKVWGGTIRYSPDQLTAMIDATVEYAAKPSHPKSGVATQFFASNSSVFGAAILFYNGETPPPGLFDSFIDAPGVVGDVKTHDTFASFAAAGDVEGQANNRATWYSAPIRSWSRELVQFIAAMAAEYSLKAAEQSKSIKFVTGHIEPFGQQAYSFNRGSAWPHDISAPYNTFNGVFVWSDPEDDEIARRLTEEYHNRIHDKAVSLGASKAKGDPEVHYPPNYSMDVTPSSLIYGHNMQWLREVQKRVDPDDLVSLTGGFKLAAKPLDERYPFEDDLWPQYPVVTGGIEQARP